MTHTVDFCWGFFCWKVTEEVPMSSLAFPVRPHFHGLGEGNTYFLNKVQKRDRIHLSRMLSRLPVEKEEHRFPLSILCNEMDNHSWKKWDKLKSVSRIQPNLKKIKNKVSFSLIYMLERLLLTVKTRWSTVSVQWEMVVGNWTWNRPNCCCCCCCINVISFICLLSRPSDNTLKQTRVTVIANLPTGFRIT